MIAMPSWWSDIGGASAISRWSAVFTAAFIIPSAVWTATYSSLDMGTALLVEFVAAAAALPFLWLAHATWLSPRRIGQRHRTLIALLTFFAVGVVRLVIMFGTRAAFDIEQPWSPLQALLTGGVYSVVVLSIVAVVVDAVRSHADVMADMRQVEDTLARARRLDEAEAQELQRAFVLEVLREVRDGVERLNKQGDTDELARGLRAMSDELVREGSHSLRDGDVVSQAVAAPRPRVTIADIVQQVRPAAPVLGPIGFEALVFTAVLRDLGPTIALVNAVVATLAFIACNLTLQAFARNRWPRRWRFTTLAVVDLSVGLLVAALVGGVILGVLGQRTPALWVGGVTYAIFMLFFSLVASLRREQQQMERVLAASLAEQAEELARVRSLVSDQRARLAHLMHGGMQAELTAAALALGREYGTPGARRDSDDIVATLMSELDRQQRSLDVTEPAVELEELFETWRLAMDIEVDCAPEVAPLLAEDADLRGRVIDVLSEALTNVVRHGDERRASVRIGMDRDRAILLVVRNPGRLDVRLEGLGSEEMTERCADWSRTQEGSDVVLRASLESAARSVG